MKAVVQQKEVKEKEEARRQLSFWQKVTDISVL